MQSTYHLRALASWFVPLVVCLVTGCETSQPPSLAKATFKTATELTAPRQKHAAVLLADQRVLVVGGIEGPPGSLLLADVFNLNGSDQEGAWTPAMHPASRVNFGVAELARLDLRATRMSDGKVLVTGGSVCVDMTANVPSSCMPGQEGCMNCDVNRKERGSVLLYDPEKPWYDAWEKRGWLTKVHTRHSVTVVPVDSGTLPNGSPSNDKSQMVYVLGGRGKNLPATLEPFMYVAGSPEPIVPVASIDLTSTSAHAIKLGGEEWSGHTATLLPRESKDPAILVVGRIMVEDKCEAFLWYPGHAPDTQWEGPLPLPDNGKLPCDGHSAEVIGPKGQEVVAIVGGQEVAEMAAGKIEMGAPLQQVLIFNPRKNWKKESPWSFIKTEVPRAYAATAVTKSGALIISGGLLKQENKDAVGRADVEKCEAAAMVCKSLPEGMKCPRVFHSMTNLYANDPDHADRFLVVGGGDATCKDGVTSGKSTEYLYLNEACLNHSDCSVGNVCRESDHRCYAK